MALNYLILSKKNKVKFNSDFDGTQTTYAYDLLSTSFNNVITTYMTPMIVTKYYVCRPDLISLAIYGSDKYADIICKINGISNPFELNEGDIINIPNVDALDSFINTTNFHQEVDDSFVDSDDDTIRKKTTSYQKLKNLNRLSSELLVGDLNYILDRTHNIVYY